MNFIMNFFSGKKNQYIGLTSFKSEKECAKKPVIKREKSPEKTALTGLLKRVG